MDKLKISIILPFPITKPVGGAKIMYEYANRLSEKGHIVSVYHSIKRPFKKSKTPVWLKLIIYKIKNIARPKWFLLLPSVKSYIVPAITNKYLPDANVVLSTWWQMAYAINELNIEKGKKFNLIQDYEIWGNQKNLVDNSYTLPISHIVIAKYLYDLVFKISSLPPIYIPNAIDVSKFHIATAPESRNPFSVIMLYSEEARKATTDGLNALLLLQKKYSKIQVILFGVYDSPKNLPSWISYIKRPENLQQLYNQSAIFISPSVSEGWALPPAEAMACGCAVVCSAIGGHADYAINKQTALLVEVNNSNDIVEKVEELFLNSELRLSLAKNGNSFIQKEFSWNANIEKMESHFNT